MKGYRHVRCSCGGVIGMFNKKDFTCEKCNKEYPLYELKYDICLTNDKTGWIFPMMKK